MKQTRTKIMGILNITPDSFYDGGRYYTPVEAFRRALKMHEDGADIIDVGGESTRPAAQPVSIDEELTRICPVIEKISSEIPVPVSVDTYKSDVAREAINAGAKIINDISGMTFDTAMSKVVSETGVEIVLMHTRGMPQDMQKNTLYRDLIQDILDFFDISIKNALNAGINKEKIIIDPGIGFGKNLEQNYTILKNIHKFTETGYPVLVGLSRKSLIGGIYQEECDRLPATIALNAVAVSNGASIVRVHDVSEHRLAMACIDFYKLRT